MTEQDYDAIRDTAAVVGRQRAAALVPAPMRATETWRYSAFIAELVGAKILCREDVETASMLPWPRSGRLLVQRAFRRLDDDDDFGDFADDLWKFGADPGNAFGGVDDE